MNILIQVVLIGMLGSQIACSDRRNTAPIFYGPDKINITEGQALNMQLIAFDPEGQTLSFSISGGDDSYHFALTPPGVLNFVDPPDFDNPVDADGDNRYELRVTAFDGVNASMQAIVITVDDNLVSTSNIEPQGAKAGSLDNSASTDDTVSMDASNDVDDYADPVDSDSADANTADDLVNTVAVEIEKTGSGNSFQEGDTLSVNISSIIAIDINEANIKYQWYFASDDGTDSPFEDVDEYELTQADVGKKLKVKVSYVDDNGETIIVESPETNIIRNVNANVDLANLAEGTGFKIGHTLSNTSRAGWSTSIVGDMDGDNLADLVIGAPAGTDNFEPYGASYVVYGSSGKSDVTLNLNEQSVIDDNYESRGFVIQGATLGDLAGESVSNAGDVNADGYADLIVGARFYDSPNLLNVGASYVIYGSSPGSNVDLRNFHASGSNNTKGFVIQGAAANAGSGYNVASAGDVNADGYADLVIGAPEFETVTDDNLAGASYIVYGSPSGSNVDLDHFDDSIGFVVDGPVGNQRTGWFVDGAGDINNDGFDDVHISGKNSPSTTYTISGSGKETQSRIDLNSMNNSVFTVSGFEQGGERGYAIRSAGDVNGDGYVDMIVSSPGASEEKGITYVVFGPRDPVDPVDVDLTNNETWGGFKIEGSSEGDQTGWGSGSAGDINGDGYGDLIISAPLATVNEQPNEQLEAGVNYIIYGKPAATDFENFTLDNIPIDDGFVITGAEAYHQSGGRASKGTGDVNGDGFDDVIIGAYDFTGSSSSFKVEKEETYECSVCASYVIYGGPTDYSPLNETLTNLGDEESLVGSHGKDKLTWQGEGAVLIGGAGNDELIIDNKNFVRIDGGNGVDTLTLASAINLNFTADKDQRGWHKNAITGIEVIDMAQDASANTLTLSAIDVLNLSNTSYTLKVNAGTKDTLGLVNTAVTAWTYDGDAGDAGDAGTYVSSNGNKATVEVNGTDLVSIIN